jgi:hypothetical protein
MEEVSLKLPEKTHLNSYEPSHENLEIKRPKL